MKKIAVAKARVLAKYPDAQVLCVSGAKDGNEVSIQCSLYDGPPMTWGQLAPGASGKTPGECWQEAERLMRGGKPRETALHCLGRESRRKADIAIFECIIRNGTADVKGPVKQLASGHQESNIYSESAIKNAIELYC
jgi:hypothetical protein